MKKQQIAKSRNRKVAVFFENVAQIVEQARRHVGRTVDLTMCVTYFEIGRMIVEEEQGGKARAEYGSELLPKLSDFLGARFGNGFSETTLKYARSFFKIYAPRIRPTLLDELPNSSETPIRQALLAKFKKGKKPIRQAMLDELASGSKNKIPQTMFTELKGKDTIPQNPEMLRQLYPFTLGWTHYLVLIRIKNDMERRFYEIEATKEQWTYRQLQRQYASSLYERLALSRNKDDVMRLSREGQTVEKPQDMIKNPLVLEFLGVDEKAEYSETKLESVVIARLQKFLLELGKGFLFEARQKRFTFDEEHFFVDLVFYNRLLQCYVLIDLKTEKLKHQDLGQMQMYVNYFDRHVKTDGEKPTIGILICKEKNDSVVKLTLPKNSNIYASEYSLYLPDKELLQSKLAEWIEEFEAEAKDKKTIFVRSRKWSG